MRCTLCDASDQGLSSYRPDGHFHAKSFHRVGEDTYCEECMSSIEEVELEFYEMDEENEDD
jgi:hypothetical protein